MQNLQELKNSTITKNYNLKASDIVLFKGNGNYTWIYMANGSKKLLCKTMHTILDDLQQLFFVRIHKSYSVNINHIKFQEMNDELTLVMTNGLKAEVSRRKKKEFLSLISMHNYFQN
ncbi:MAG: LytTR family DNA-binding domain-containing protein [Bacteroidota bacterium]